MFKRIFLLLVVLGAFTLPAIVHADTVFVAGNAFSFSLDKTVFSSGETATIHACTTLEVGANQSFNFPQGRYMSIRFANGGGTINGTPTIGIFPSLTYTGLAPGNVDPEHLDIDVLSAVSKLTIENEDEVGVHFVTGDIMCFTISYTAPTVSIVTPIRVEEYNNLKNAGGSEVSALTLTVNP